MKRTLFLFSLLVSFGPVIGHGQASTTTTMEREVYADRVGQELRQIRQQVDEIGRKTPLAGQQRLAPIYDALLEAEQSLAMMKTANALEFTLRKSEVESSRSKVSRLWREYKLSSDTVPVAPPVNVPTTPDVMP
jgi:hypothetical protein